MWLTSASFLYSLAKRYINESFQVINILIGHILRWIVEILLIL